VRGDGFEGGEITGACGCGDEAPIVILLEFIEGGAADGGPIMRGGVPPGGPIMRGGIPPGGAVGGGPSGLGRPEVIILAGGLSGGAILGGAAVAVGGFSSGGAAEGRGARGAKPLAGAKIPDRLKIYYYRERRHGTKNIMYCGANYCMYNLPL
jgi:hypothetical protein